MELLPFLLSTLLLGVPSISSQPAYHRSSGAPIGRDGRVVDTPEVAQAKAAHLAAFSRLAGSPPPLPAARYNGAPALVPSHTAYGPVAAYSNPSFFSTRVQHGPYGYRGPPAPLAHDGRVLDTPEVAQAKAAHLAAFNQAASRSPYYDAPAIGEYNGNSASAEDDGEYRPGSYSSDDDESGSAEGYASYEGSAGRYQGPPAPLAEDGRVVDTPEVAQAKAAHLAAFQRAAQGQYKQPYSGPNTAGYYGDY